MAVTDSPSKELIERAKDRGFEYLDGYYFRKRGSYYLYEPDKEMMVIVPKEEYEEYLRQKEKAEQEGIQEALQESLPLEKKAEQPERPKRQKERLEKPREGVEEVQYDIIGPMDEEMLAEIEMADERQIVEEMRGRVLMEYFYSFEAGGREVVGLSYAGVKQLAREMARRREPIDIEDLEVNEDEESVQIIAKAVNKKTGEHRFGASPKQPKVMTLKDGSRREDPYAYQKALSKAQRNALRAFIPEEIIIEMFKEWRKQREERERFLGG